MRMSHLVPLVAIGLLAAACERDPATEEIAPGMEAPRPQTTAPGDPLPGAEPIPQTAPGVIQEDTLRHPGQPGPDASPGI
jgi:hypothetical protein